MSDLFDPDSEDTFSEQPEEIFRFVVDPESCQARLRLDRYLKAALLAIFGHATSRSQLQRLTELGKITVNGEPCRPSLVLSGGEVVEVCCPKPVNLDVKPEDIALDVVFEDEHLLVVNKPAGMVVHPGAGAPAGTLVNALLHHCRDSLSGIGGVLRPGIVHRLDKDTSGLLVVAKNDRAHTSLQRQIQEKSATRIYLALLEGKIPPSGLVDRPVGRMKADRKKMAIEDDGRPAKTAFELLEDFDRFCLARLKLYTGRTHQIRVHMASLGAPVVGDLVYNRKSTGQPGSRARLGLNGQALHAAYLSFSHPVSFELLEFQVELPPDILRLVESLRAGERYVT